MKSVQSTDTNHCVSVRYFFLFMQPCTQYVRFLLPKRLSFYLSFSFFILVKYSSDKRPKNTLRFILLQCKRHKVLKYGIRRYCYCRPEQTTIIPRLLQYTLICLYCTYAVWKKLVGQSKKKSSVSLDNDDDDDYDDDTTVVVAVV